VTAAGRDAVHRSAAARIAAALLALTAAPPASHAANKEDVARQVIATHGTYLDSAAPMPCGAGEPAEGALARVGELFAKVAAWPNFRAVYPMGTWAKDVAACRLPAAPDACAQLLAQAGVAFTTPAAVPGIEAPVELGATVGGVRFVSSAPLVMACDLALALARAAEVMAAAGVEKVGVLSLHRPGAAYTFHSLGLAMDVQWVKAKKWGAPVWLAGSFEQDPKERTCEYKPATPKGRFLMDVACALWGAKVFTTVITPNYNKAHANHFHFDLRTGDNRFYLR